MSLFRHPLPPIEYIRETFDYNPWTGAMIRRSSPQWWKVGKRAGARATGGYLQTWLDGRLYAVHRLAWAHYWGCDPPTEIDHINGERDDNRASNLRLATRANNQHNTSARNKLGLKGVSRARGRYVAEIRANGRRMYLGIFDTPEEAHAAYTAAAHQHHSAFARSVAT